MAGNPKSIIDHHQLISKSRSRGNDLVMVEDSQQPAPMNVDSAPVEVPSTAETDKKVDKITALQDAIDGLSLAMFEALRGLRDAVAPESGNLGGDGNQNENHEPDLEEFWTLYRSGDPTTVAMVQKVSPTPPKKREEYARIFAKIESLRDAALVKRLADTVLEKSADINERVDRLPGMDRTRSEQMKYIEELLKKNQEVATKLEETYDQAKKRRGHVRTYIQNNTCSALGIVEETD